MKTLTVTALLGWAPAMLITTGLAQPFSSGSDGSYGPLIVGTNTTLDMPPDGIFRCTTIVVSNGATLKFRRNALNTPVYLLATSNVTVDGEIDVSGSPGVVGAAGAGGPGGFDGGKPANGPGFLPGDGLGPGGGIGASSSGAYASAGVTHSPANCVIPIDINTNLYGNSVLIPLLGGSGGGGGSFGDVGGPGGGGAILAASDTRIDINGRIYARGGRNTSTAGSGGAIRIVAPVVAGPGSLYAGEERVAPFNCYARGGAGRIRIDATNRFSLFINFDGGRTIGSYMKVFPDIVPRLDILEAAGQSIAEGTNAAVQITLPAGSPTNQTIRVQARDFTGIVPITVVVTPDNGPSMKYPSQIDMGAGNPSQVTVNVVIPADTTCRIHAWTVGG